MSGTAGLQVRFSLEAKNVDGRWVNVEYIRILSMTDKYNQPHRPVEPADKVRWAPQYEAWKKGLAEPAVGQPLKAWPGIAPAEVQVLAQAGLHTVEALAAAPDNLVGEEGPYLALREATRQYLALSSKAGALQDLAREAKEARAEAAEMREQAAAARRELEELRGHAPEDDGAPPRRGPGRPRKTQEPSPSE